MNTSANDRPAIILIAEDELLVRLMVNDILEDAGYHTIEARDGEEALAILALRPDIRLLFTDVTMPFLDGISLAKIVLERWPGIKVIITSALTPPAENMPEGVPFLPKPCRPEKLLEAVRAALPTDTAQPSPALPASIMMEQPALPGGLAQPLSEPEE